MEGRGGVEARDEMEVGDEVGVENKRNGESRIEKRIEAYQLLSSLCLCASLAGSLPRETGKQLLESFFDEHETRR